MTTSRYALRSAAFAAAYLAVFLAAAATPLVQLPPLAVAAAWLTAQAGYGRRRLDVTMLATAAAVAATLQGADLMMCLVVAAGAVVPALLFAVLLDRRLPGYWAGRSRAALGPAAVVAALAAAAGVVLAGVTDTGLGLGTAAWLLARDTLVLFLMPLLVRLLRGLRSPAPAPTAPPAKSSRRSHLTVVR